MAVGERRDPYLSFNFLVELKGLAGIGKKTAEFLSQRIPGYESEF